MAAVVPLKALLAEVAVYSGPGTVRAATEADAVDGMRPRLVAEPGDAAELAATLGWVSAEHLKVLVRGGGTKLTWGAPCGPIDLVLSTAGLCSVTEHRYGDLTATVEAGAPLASVNATLGAHRQWLPLDPFWPERATIGGIVATNDSGPRRHRHGAPRDLIIGVTLARADGQLAKAGGIVVKNVAGYDLSRLLTGSFGCLGVIVSATFKLAPIASASRTVVVEPAPGTLAAVVRDVTASALTPTALELEWSPPRALIRFESVEAAVVDQAAEARRLVAGSGQATVVSGNDEAEVWRHHRAFSDGPGTLIKLSTLPTELVPTLRWLQETVAQEGLQVMAAGRAGLGVVDVRLEGSLDVQARTIIALRARLSGGDGSATIRRGEPTLRQLVDAWGSIPIGDGLRVMQAVKRRFDPTDMLNSGRGPSGL